MSSMITCASWVCRGVAKTIPDKVELSQEELQELIKVTEEKLKEKQVENEGNMEETLLKYRPVSNDSDNSDNEESAVLKEYDLDNYDEDGEGVVMTGAGMSGLTYFASNETDPYITLKNQGDDDKDDINIKPTDNLIVIGKVDEELSNLEIYVYNEEDNDLYVHHDILLDTFPLALEWINFDPEYKEKTANLLAVGTMEPYINIWDLDVLDTVEPVLTLGSKKKKSKKNSNNAPNHKDAVLDLSWNKNVRNVLCSGSADSMVILWDMEEGKAAQVLKHHKDKVQSICWHPYEAQSLLTGSFDKTACVLDCRNPESGTKVWKLHGEVECVIWNHFSPFQFLASTDKGCIFCCDVRMDDPVFTIHAHDEAVTGIALSSQLPGCLMSVSQDKIAKVWDIENNKPSCVVSRDMKMGSILNVSSCPDSPYIFALGGEKQGLQLFDISQSAPGWNHFENRQCLVNTSNHSVGSKTNGKEQNETSDTAITENNEHMDVDLTTATAMESLSLKTQGQSNKTSKKHKKKKKKK